MKKQGVNKIIKEEKRFTEKNKKKQKQTLKNNIKNMSKEERD